MAHARAIESDPAFLHFREKHELAARTWEGYIIALQKYSDFNQLSLTDLIDEAEREELERMPLERRNLGSRIRGFRKHLKEGGLAPTSIRGNLAAVKSFYKNGFSLQVPTLGRDRDMHVRVREENKGIPAYDDIIKALQVADVRERGIVLGITSSGLSASDLLTITVREFREGHDNETGITVLDMRRMKTRQDFVTFFSAEATMAIDQYLKWRDRPRPKTMHQGLVQAWATHRIYTEDDYLFCKERIPASFLSTWDEGLRRESEAGLQEVFRSLARRAGIARGKGTWNMFRAHKLRAWFYSTLLNAGCPMEYAGLFMGH